jgi:hypothetical protein
MCKWVIDVQRHESPFGVHMADCRMAKRQRDVDLWSSIDTHEALQIISDSLISLHALVVTP